MRSERSLGQMTLTVNGQTVYFVPSRLSVSRIMEAGGFAQDATIAFLCERSQFSTIPKSQALVVNNVDGKRYRVVTVTESTDGSHVVLECGDVNNKI